MEWLKAILEKAKIEDGKLDIDGVMSTVNLSLIHILQTAERYSVIGISQRLFVLTMLYVQNIVVV